MPRSRMRSVSRRDKSGLVWCAAGGAQQVVAPAAVIEFPVVDMATDVNFGSSGTQATLLRIRGWFGAHALTTPTGNTTYDIVGICMVLDDDEALPSPGAIQTYIDEDVFWTGGVTFQVFGTGVTPGISFSLAVPSQVVDIRAKRRLRTGKTVSILFQNNGGSNVTISAFFRGLVKLR